MALATLSLPSRLQEVTLHAPKARLGEVTLATLPAADRSRSIHSPSVASVPKAPQRR